MQWSESQDGNIVTLTLGGEIDLQYSPELRKILQEKIKARCPVLVIEFSGVEYIDSSGLATLVEYCRDSRAFAGALALAGLRERVRTIFDLVRLNELLTIYTTLDEAKMAIRASEKQRV